MVNGEGKNFQFPGLFGRAFFFAFGKGTRTLQRFKCYYRDLSITKSWAVLGRWGEMLKKKFYILVASSLAFIKIEFFQF